MQEQKELKTRLKKLEEEYLEEVRKSALCGVLNEKIGKLLDQIEEVKSQIELKGDLNE